MTIIYFIALFIFLCIAALLCFVILIQESKSSGIGQVFGASDAGDSLFGTSTADVIKKFTAWLSALFLILCVVLSFWTQALWHTKSSVESYPVIEQEQNGS